MLQRLTSLNRPLSWGYASNRFIMGLTLVSIIVQLLLQRDWSLYGLWLVVSAAVWAFTSWALGRELDPDDPGTAAWSAVATALSLLLLPPAWYPPGMTATGILMLVARVTARTTGRSLTPADVGALVAVPPIAVLVAQAPLWVLAVALALALGLEFWREQRPLYGWGAMAALLSGGLAWWIEPRQGVLAAPIWVMGIVGLGLVVLAVVHHPPRSTADNGLPLSAGRLRWARGLVVLGSVLSLAVVGFGPLLSVGWVGVCLGLRGALGRRGNLSDKQQAAS